MDERSYDDASSVNDGTNDNEDTVTESSPESTEPPKAPEEAEFRIVPEEDFVGGQEPLEAPTPQKAKKQKKQASVPLVAYVASLLAVVLVMSMFTFAFSFAARRYGYNEGLADKLDTSGGIGEDLFESLFGDLFGDRDDDAKFAALEKLDWIFRTYGYETYDDVDFLTAVMDAYVDASGDLYAEYYTEEEFRALTSESAGVISFNIFIY